MEEIKILALNLCLCAILFGILRNIISMQKYEVWIKPVLGVVFLLMIIGGVRKINPQKLFPFANAAKTTEEVNVRESLKQITIGYINEKLLENGYLAECYDADLINENNSYRLRSVSVKAAQSKEEVISMICNLTKLSEENIYVTTGSD